MLYETVIFPKDKEPETPTEDALKQQATVTVKLENDQANRKPD